MHRKTQLNSPPASLGNIYPRDDIVAVIDDRESAERAVRALRNAGLPEDDEDLFDGPSLVEANRSFVQHRGMLQSFESWLPEPFSADLPDARAYLYEAEHC